MKNQSNIRLQSYLTDNLKSQDWILFLFLKNLRRSVDMSNRQRINPNIVTSNIEIKPMDNNASAFTKSRAKSLNHFIPSVEPSR